MNPFELLNTSDEGPIDFTLTAEHYDWEGNLIDATPLGNVTERSPEAYQAAFDSAIASEVGAIGASRYGDAVYTPLQDADDDAVLYGSNGEELVRYPDTDASFMHATISSDGKIAVVTNLGSEFQTDIFTIGE